MPEFDKSNFEGKEILIAEDSLTQSEQLKFILEEQRFKVHVANNGKEALEYLKENKPELVISDIIMPEMDGYELCSRMNADDELKDIPVILLTSLSDPHDVIKGLQAGADNFLTKPYKEEFLLSRIQYVLLNKQIREDLSGDQGIEIVFAGQKYNITSDRMQIIDLLLSTYENAIYKNEELAQANQELTNMHRELAKKNAQLEKLNDEKNKFLGMAAHDLRNPLSAVLGFSNFVLEEAEELLSDDHVEFLHIIRDSSEFMLQMVNDLLDISQIESGKLVLTKVLIEVVPYIERIVSLNRVWADKKSIKLKFKHDKVASVVMIDPQKMEQVLNNLITNGIKFSQANTEIAILLTKDDDDLIISVQDQGQGIPETELDKLFKPFSKTSVRGTAGEKSTGLGLVIARKIVEGHKGKIWVESEVGKGSTFYVSLPLKEH